MTWYVPVLLRIVVGNILGQIVLKKMVGLPSRTRRLTWQFVFCALFGWIGVACAGVPAPTIAILGTIASIGAVNSIGAYCQWRAMAISQSRTALFTWADDCIAIALGYLLLAEHQLLTLWLVVGVLACIGASTAFPFTERTRADAQRRSYALMGWVAGYSVIWGIAAFSMRVFGLKDVPVLWFCTAWYTGAVIGAVVIQLTAGAAEAGARLTIRGLGSVFILATFIASALGLAYWSRMLAPITVVQPIHQVSEMIFPALIGLFVFREAKQLSRSGWCLFAIAFLGGLAIALSYS